MKTQQRIDPIAATGILRFKEVPKTKLVNIGWLEQANSNKRRDKLLTQEFHHIRFKRLVGLFHDLTDHCCIPHQDERGHVFDVVRLLQARGAGFVPGQPDDLDSG